MLSFFNEDRIWFESAWIKNFGPHIVITLTIAIFLLDTVTPRSFVDWMFYVIPVFFTVILWSRRTISILIVCTVFITAGYYLSPLNRPVYIGAVNRGVGAVVLWATAGLLVLRKRDTDKLREVSQQLLKEKQAKANFLADASHELRTPLAIIQSIVDVSAKQPNPYKLDKDMLQGMNTEIRHMSELISELTAMAKTQPLNKSELHYETINLKDLLSDIAERHELLAKKRKIVISHNVPSIIFEGDLKKLIKLFSNLVTNAIRHGKEGGTVWISATCDDGFISVEVADDGIGIPENEYPHIFERFYRINGQDDEGTGLGLAICKLIVESHDGSISVSSRQNEGSIFSVRLPIAKKIQDGN